MSNPILADSYESLLTPDELENVLNLLAEHYRLPAHKIIVTPYWIPGVPDVSPDVAVGYNRWRIPEGLDLSLAGHPVFWLPRSVLARRNEMIDTRGVRLWTEIVARDGVDEDGEPIDVLYPDVDLTEEEGQRRLFNWLSGETDPFLSQFCFGPDEELANIALITERTDDLREQWFSQTIAIAEQEVEAVWEAEATLARSGSDATQLISELEPAIAANDTDIAKVLTVATFNLWCEARRCHTVIDTDGEDQEPSDADIEKRDGWIAVSGTKAAWEYAMTTLTKMAK